MSIFDDIKHAAEKVIDTATDTAEDAAGEVLSISGDIKKEIKDIAKEVVEEIFPEELKQQLPDAFKNLEKTVVQEVVKTIITPVLTEIVKPIEKIMFDRGAHALQIAYDKTKKLLSDAYVKPQDLIDRAIEYSKEQTDADNNPWLKWLGAMGVSGYAVDPDVTEDFWDFQVEIWDGWQPFVDALHKYEHRSQFTREEVIRDFDKCSFYVANTGNLSIGMYFTNMYERAPEVIATLNKYKNTGVPIKRKDIENFIEEVGPDTLDITGSAKFDIGIQVGGSVGLWGVPTQLCLYFLDEILEYAGVPE